MDAALRPYLEGKTPPFTGRFNPCFSGCRPATTYHGFLWGWIDGFNPCFSGCRPATSPTHKPPDRLHRVSILVLVDAALRLIEKHISVFHIQVSILVLVDAALRPVPPLCVQSSLSVSILVLVDAALRLVKLGFYRVVYVWFQSLF